MARRCGARVALGAAGQLSACSDVPSVGLCEGRRCVERLLAQHAIDAVAAMPEVDPLMHLRELTHLNQRPLAEALEADLGI